MSRKTLEQYAALFESRGISQSLYRGINGEWKPLLPGLVGRPLTHEEMDYNMELNDEVLKDFRVRSSMGGESFGAGDVGKYLVFSGTSGEYFWTTAEAVGGTGGVGSSGTSGVDGSFLGTHGTSGIDGVDGTSGTSGVDGIQGATGIPGSSGTSGSSGVNGIQGATGIPGTSGTSGVSGVDGTSGVDGSFLGTHGTSGTSGVDGLVGESGTSGTSGIDGSFLGTHGTSGTSGTDGLVGNDGTSGTSGESGTSGVDGLIGVDGTSGTSGTTPSPGGSNGDIQYNDAGSLNGTSAFKISGNKMIVNHIEPETDITFDLGTPTKRFKDLYMSGSTIYMDEHTLGIVDSQLAFDGQPVGGGSGGGGTTPISFLYSFGPRNTTGTWLSIPVTDGPLSTIDNTKRFKIEWQGGQYYAEDFFGHYFTQTGIMPDSTPNNTAGAKKVLGGMPLLIWDDAMFPSETGKVASSFGTSHNSYQSWEDVGNAYGASYTSEVYLTYNGTNFTWKIRSRNPVAGNSDSLNGIDWYVRGWITYLD